eukprot:jgi/Hompol1/4932/HPOL_004044-RA
MDMDVMFNLHRIKSKIASPPVPETASASSSGLRTKSRDSRQPSESDGVAPSGELIMRKGGEIVFDNVTFGYSEDRPILRGISFTIPAGKRVAFVGTSGSGEFYDPISGTISIDSQDIRSVNVDSLRRHIAVVPQDTILFNQSIFYNIAYGRPDASKEQVYEAAKRAAIHDVIVDKFPKGYDTPVGERGLMVSGGEKQRVQLARVFLKDSPIVLFDEATSALDQTTETAILNTIR